ncbi:MAG: cytochrome c oxidase subunit II [Hyphomicrobiales bacterium]|nr:cytochrome c oxidase subunit II [Hyphomicrobiales bacterium]
MRGPMNRVLSRASALSGAASALFMPALALAAPNGQPQPGQMNLPAPATPKMADIVWFHDWLLVLITLISVFVLALLVYACWRFAEKKNPVPSKLTHHAGLEVAWTIIPVLILVVVAIPSFRILRDQLVIPPSDITLKVTGKQWYWSWEYPKDAGGFGFDSLMLDDKQRLELVNTGKAKPEEVPRLLGVDNEAVVPVGKIVRLQVTAADVIHKFAMPAFGLKLDAIPGRLNETWFKAEKEGLYFGQCSFICGQNHSYMPIAIRVVSQERYAAWLAESQKKFAVTDGAPTRVAAVVGQ